MERLLRARNLSSDSTATALTRRIDTANVVSFGEQIGAEKDEVYRRRDFPSRKASYRRYCGEGGGAAGGKTLELVCIFAEKGAVPCRADRDGGAVPRLLSSAGVGLESP